MGRKWDKQKLEEYNKTYAVQTRLKRNEKRKAKLPFQTWGCDTEGTRENEKTGKQSKFRFGIIARSKDDYEKFSKPSKFWEIILDEMKNNLYITFYNLNWDFVYLYPSMPEFDNHPQINWFSHPSFIKIKRKIDNRRTQQINITDLANYFPREGETSELWEKQKLDDISKSFLPLEYRKINVDKHKKNWNNWCTLSNPEAVKYCFQDALICKLVLDSIFDYFGAKAISISGITGKWLKKLIGIEVNRPRYVVNNEIESYRGGITNVYDFSYPLKKVFNFDIVACYHSVMANNPLPYRFNHKLRGDEVRNFDVLTNDNHAYLCRALVEVYHPCLSVVDNTRNMLQPVGTFRGVWWNNLLSFMIQNNLGCVRRYGEIFQYDLTDAHQPELLKMWDERLIAKEKKDKLKEHYIKLATNTSYGKLGEKRRITKILSETQALKLFDSFKEDENMDYIDSYEDAHGNIKEQLWKVQRFGNYYYFKANIERQEAFGAFTAGGSYIVSKAQELLLDYMLKCRWKNSYSDSDSLKVPVEYYYLMKNFVNPKKLGYLKVEYEEKPSYILPLGAKAYLLFFGNEFQINEKPDTQTLVDYLNDKDNPNIVRKIKGFSPETIFKLDGKGNIIGESKHVLKYKEAIKRKTQPNIFIRQPRTLQNEKIFSKSWVDNEGKVYPLELDNGNLIINEGSKNYVNREHVISHWLGKMIYEAVGNYERINA